MRSAAWRAAGALEVWYRDRFAGVVSPWPYALFRIGIAVSILVRTNDWLRPIFTLDHYAWVRGLEYDPQIEQVVSPALQSPLIPGLSIGPALAAFLVRARTSLAVVLLLGIKPRLTASILALIGAALVAADRYRYFHHLYLLWLSCAWLAITPSSERLSLERWVGRWPRAVSAPRWPLQILRQQCIIVYLASGVAKLNSDWLSGRTLSALEGLGLVRGALWHRGISLIGYSGAGTGIAVAECALGPLLAWRRTRFWALGAGALFHLAISATMSVSIFSLLMILYLATFLPFQECGVSSA
ncbi:MAG TPA: HTTM domain-containing protein [Polyangiaceae bacterium]|jgi:hypothetical protein